MNQIEALIVVMGLGFMVSVFVSNLAKDFSIFLCSDARMYLGIGGWMLMLNFWPLLSSEPLVNRAGEAMSSSSLFFITLLFFIFCLFLALKVEEKSKKQKVQKTNERFIFITTLAWFLLLASCVSLVSLGKAYIGGDEEVIEAIKTQSALPLAWQYVYITASGIINILCAVLIFKAVRYGRILFAGWTSISVFIAFITHADKASIIWSLIFYMVFIAILFSPKGDEYFYRVKQ